MTSSILVPSATRFNFQDHMTKRKTGSDDENAPLVLGLAQQRRDPKCHCHPEFRTRVTRNNSHGDKIKSSLVSLFFSWCRKRIKFKSLWTFSFCALFVFLELLWFTSLVSFTGSYIEDKPKFFCDCPTDVSLRSPFPTCFLFLSSFFSFFGYLLIFTSLHFGGSLVEILSKKSISQWHERITGMR